LIVPGTVVCLAVEHEFTRKIIAQNERNSNKRMSNNRRTNL